MASRRSGPAEGDDASDDELTDDEAEHDQAEGGVAQKMAGAVAGGIYADLTPEELQWCERFIGEVAPLTGNGFPGRYAGATVSGRRLDEVWCCINPGALRDAAIFFAGITVRHAAEISTEVSAP